MASVFEVLSRDHEQVKRMLAELEKGPTAAAGAGQRQLALREEMVEQLIIAASRHEAAEEMFFWPVVHEQQHTGHLLAEAAVQQEQDGKQLLQRLGQASPGQPDFEDLLAQFTQAARDHILFEETSVWPGLKASLSEPDAAALGRRLELARKVAPSMPHPRVPASPALLRGAGPVIAAADRVRGAVNRRRS
ncbi:MAG TPA: hemerythrin domain-containing protein [Trebonia sp.]|nr:hemerythrin domain-containing protein [Trebonia sp.]